MFVFGGSAYFGMKQAGVAVDTILEISDDVVKQNSYHLIKNEAANVVKRSDWEGKLGDYHKENYDIMFSNAPCSGLSQINRNASADNDTNKYIYEAARAAMEIEPKVFILENAPTLATVGAPILKEITSMMKEKYYFTILRDVGKHHGVCMQRMRTIVFAWHKNYFDGPSLLPLERNEITAEEFLKGVKIHPANDRLPKEHLNNPFESFFGICQEGKSIGHSLAINGTETDLEVLELKSKSLHKQVVRIADKLSRDENIFDKSPFMPLKSGLLPSMTSLSHVIHPIEKRSLKIGEYAALMGYPSDFIFYDESEVPVIQAIAQGVPAGYVKYFCESAAMALEEADFKEGETTEPISEIIFQNSPQCKFVHVNYSDFDKFNKFDIKEISEKCNVEIGKISL